MPESRQAPLHQVQFDSRAFRAAVVTYFVMGIVASMFGPLLDTLAETLHVSLTTASETIPIFNAGGFLGVLLAWWGLRHHGGRAVAVLGLWLLATGAIGGSLAQHWLQWMPSVAALGLGFGILNLGLNSMMARTPREGRSSRLSIGNATYGLGAVAGPLLTIAAGSHHFQLIYASLIPVAIIVALFFVDLTAPPAPTQSRHATINNPLRRVILRTFIIGFSCYLAFESTLTGWAASVLHADGYSTALGGVATAGFWAGFAAGRIVAAFLHRFISARRIVFTGITSSVLVAPLAAQHRLAPYVFVALGLLVSATFPMGLMWFSEVSSYDSEGLSLLIALMGTGAIIGPALVSHFVAAHGIGLVPWFIALYGALTSGVLFRALRFPIAPQN